MRNNRSNPGFSSNAILGVFAEESYRFGPFVSEKEDSVNIDNSDESFFRDFDYIPEEGKEVF